MEDGAQGAHDIEPVAVAAGEDIADEDIDDEVEADAGAAIADEAAADEAIAEAAAGEAAAGEAIDDEAAEAVVENENVAAHPAIVNDVLQQLLEEEDWDSSTDAYLDNKVYVDGFGNEFMDESMNYIFQDGTTPEQSDVDFDPEEEEQRNRRSNRIRKKNVK